MNENKSDLGFHAYIRGIILIGFALLMVALIISDNIRFYIAPKMMPFIYFGMVTFLILGVIQILRSTKKGQEDEEFCDCGADHSMPGSPVLKLLIYSIFIIPIVMGFVLPDKALDSSVAANRGIQYGSGILTKPTGGGSDFSRAEAFLEDPDGYFSDLENDYLEGEHFTIEDYYSEEDFNQYYSELKEQFQRDNEIIVTAENYLDVMTVLDLYIDEFVGKTMEIKGFVYREPDFLDHQLVVARFSMTCCVADAAVYGTMVETDFAYEYENDTWVKVRGILQKSTYNEFTIPLIQLREIEVVEEPHQPYVFPSFR